MFWCKNYYSVIFLSKVTNYWKLTCRISSKNALQRYGLTSSKSALQRYGLTKTIIYVYFYRLIKNKMFLNTSFLPYFHWKKVFVLSWLSLVWNLERIYHKWKILTLLIFLTMLIFLTITQNLFYHKEPHLVILGYKSCRLGDGIYVANRLKVLVPIHSLIHPIFFKHMEILVPEVESFLESFMCEVLCTNSV